MRLQEEDKIILTIIPLCVLFVYLLVLFMNWLINNGYWDRIL